MTPKPIEALASAGLDLRPRSEDQEGWARVWSEARYQPVSYSASMIDYQHAYLKGASGWSLQDASQVLLNDGRPCGIWPLTFGGVGSLGLSSQAGPVMAPLFARGTARKTVKRLVGQALAGLLALCGTVSMAGVEAAESLCPAEAEDGVSEWYQQSLARGGRLRRVRHVMWTDLRPGMDHIRSGFRKSYRPLVTSGLRLWNAQVMDARNADPAVWSRFRELHRSVAGRVTRPLDTWDHQWRMVVANQALLVHLSDEADGGRMVGAGFFQYGRDEALYAVAAYDRSLFDKPVGHVVQAVAIEEFKRRGMSWYRLGELPYPGDDPAPTDKELAIARFKEGFASHTCVRLEFWIPVQGEPGGGA